MWLIGLVVAVGWSAEPSAVGPAEAMTIAQDRLPGGSAQVERVRVRIGGRWVDTWSVHLDRPAAGFIAPIVRVDPRSGVVLRIDEGAVDAGPLTVAAHPASDAGIRSAGLFAPLARVYPNNPVVDGEPIEVELVGAETQLEDERLEVLQCRDFGDTRVSFDTEDRAWNLRRCTEVPAMGPRPDTGYLYPPIPWPVDPGRDEDVFVASQLYWAVHQGLDWFDDLGWVADPEYDPRVTVVANLRNTDLFTEESATDPAASLAPYNNAYHQRGYWDWEDNWVMPRLVFGQGSEIDYGYDTDVVFHELAHMIVSSTFGPSYSLAGDTGPRVEGNALNEGIADYFASAMQEDPALAEYAGGSDRDAIRHLVGDASCRGDLWGESHYDSQPFSQGLWEVRSELAPADQRILDQTLLFALPEIGEVTDFARAYAVLTEAVDASLGIQTGDRLRQEWQDRGVDDCVAVLDVIPSDEPVRRFTQVPAHSPFSEVSRVPGYLQFRVEVPEPGSKVRISALQLEFTGLDLYGTNEPEDVRVIGGFGDRITWTDEPVETEITFSGYTLLFEVTDWRHDATALGSLERVASEPWNESPERYIAHTYALQLEPEQSGTLVFQFANTAERSASLYDLTVQVDAPIPTADPHEDAQAACGCATTSGPAWSWLGLALLCLSRRREP